MEELLVGILLLQAFRIMQTHSQYEQLIRALDKIYKRLNKTPIE